MKSSGTESETLGVETIRSSETNQALNSEAIESLQECIDETHTPTVDYEESPLLSPDDETMPLLQDRGTDRVYNTAALPPDYNSALSWAIAYIFRSLTSRVIFICITGLLAMNALYLSRSIPNALMEAVHVNLDNCAVLGWTETGVSLKIEGSVFVNYSKISNWYPRILTYTVGVTMGSITVLSQSPVDVYAEFGDQGPKHVITFHPPPLSILLADRSITPLAFTSEVIVVSQNVVLFMTAVIRQKELGAEKLPITLSGSVNTSISSTRINYGNYYTMVRKQIEFPVPADPRSDILDYMVRDTIDGVDLAISASLPYEYPVSMHIPALKWEIFCPDCDTSMVKVSSVTTSSIFLQPYRYFIVSVVAEIPRFPRNIVASCPDGRSPLDVLVQETLAAKKMKVYVRASKFQNEDLPGWVVYAMSKVFVPVAFAAPQLSVEVPLTEFKIRNTIITIPSVDGYQPFLDSNVTFSVGIPKESHCVVELLGLRGRFEVEHQGETLGGVYIESMQPVKSSMDRDLTISVFEKDGRCFTGNDVAIANILQRFLDGKSSRVSIISTGDVKLSSALLESTIRGISGTAMATLSGWNTTFPALRPEPMIQNITFLQSSPNMIQVRVLVETNNQLDISLKMDELDIFFGSKKALFGHATVHRIQMEARKRFVFTVDVTLDPLSYSDEGFRQLSLFASSYISGIDQTIKLEGHSGSVPTSSNISNILSHLSVELSVPEIKYPLNMGSRNPFIISSIMHVMTMEVEVVVYNPMSNMDVIITVDSAEAIYEGNIVGCIDHAETVTAPPGISTTRKISVSPRNGLVRDALLKLVNRKVQVDCLCRITASIGGFSLDLIFTGSGIETEIRM